MKKFISLTLALLLALTVFGCLSLAVAENAEVGGNRTGKVWDHRRDG